MLGRVGDADQGLAGTAKNVVSVLEIDEVVGVLHHGHEIGLQKRRVWLVQVSGIGQLQAQRQDRLVGEFQRVLTPDTTDAAIGMTKTDVEAVGKWGKHWRKQLVNNVLIVLVNQTRPTKVTAQKLRCGIAQQVFDRCADRYKPWRGFPRELDEGFPVV